MPASMAVPLRCRNPRILEDAARKMRVFTENDLFAGLRATPEWTYVDRKIDIRRGRARR